MKRFFRVLLFLLIVLVFVLAYNFMSFKSVQPEAFDQEPPQVSDSAAIHLSEAIQFKTISHKIEMMPTEEMDGLLNYMEKAYPLFHEKVSKKIYSTHTLLYTWKGSDPNLKPVMYMGHMDVVPIEKATRNQWLFKPFSGTIDNDTIYGRGTLDDKGTVIGLLEAAEMLAQEGFQPKRTIYFLFGQDEEINGAEGAGLVAEDFEKKGIELEMIWDEGTVIGQNLVPGFKDEVALISIAEKGYVSFVLTCQLPGGHSSIPPIQTAIGSLNNALVRLDQNPFPYTISAPIEGFIEYIGPESPFMNKLAFSNPWLFKPLIFNSYAATGSGRAMIQTTMTPTVVKAGVKDNVVPAKAQAIVNCRILPGETVESTQSRIASIIADSSITISKQETQVNPSKSSEYNNPYFNTIGSAVKTVYPKAHAAPFLMLGATDSRHFDNVCDRIYKFAPFVYRSEELKLLHGINEKIAVENFKNGIQIYYLVLKNINTL